MNRPASLLVVDDSEPNRDALSRRLQMRGYAVTVAASGQEALALALDVRFDLVLLDVEMPGTSGLEVLTELRLTQSNTDLPVIMVTARTEGTDIVEAFRLGANDYVTKPIDFPVLLARLATHLAHKQAIEALRESEERYALAVSGVNDGVWDWNLVTDEVYWSPRWKAMLGHEESEIGSGPGEWLSRVHHEDVEGVKETLAQHLSAGIGHYESEHRIQHHNGTFRWVRCRGSAVRNSSGVATRLAGSLTDITDGKVADALTGLPNRLLFVDLLERAIKRTKRHKDYAFALLVLGLDRFKTVNASLGLLSADQLLVAVARRLQASLRTTDAISRDGRSFTLARLGGDEFTVLVDDVGDARDVMLVAERLRATFLNPFIVDGQQVFTSATVGIAVSSTGYERPDDILRDASIALHRAKSAGGTSCELFDPAMRQRAVARLQAETELRQAIETRAFAVFYQPIVCLTTGVIVAFEALARWRHPARGIVSPAEFIPLAEETGMIFDIAKLTLAESCRQMAAWRRTFGAEAPAAISVNLSNTQFADPALLGEIRAMLEETALEPSALKLEITESAFIEDIDAAERTLERAQAMGIEWSLDDFGTGYSSLSCLHRLRVATVKVDKSFVSHMGFGEKGSEMVKAIVAMARNLGMDVVAEGVETEGQFAQLRALGCDMAQGYYFSRPVDAATAEGLITHQPWRHHHEAAPLALVGSQKP